jgi:hypothetical protein
MCQDIGSKRFSLQGKLLFTKKTTSANEEIKLQVIGHLFINIESKSGSNFNQK